MNIFATTSVDTITKQLKTIQDDLYTHTAKKNTEALELQEKADEARKESTRAYNIANRLANLLGE